MLLLASLISPLIWSAAVATISLAKQKTTLQLQSQIVKMTYSALFLLMLSLLVVGERNAKNVENNPKRGPTLPYYASIFIDDAWFCTGSLISDTLVLTAAHCVQGGAFFDISLGEQQFSSSEAILHPDYDQSTFSADLAVIRLPEPAQVDPAPLPEAGDALEVGDSVCLDDLDGSFVCAQVLSDADCFDAFGSVSEDIVCLDNTLGNMCTGVYSGAPGTTTATNPGTLVGVTTMSGSAGCEVGSPIGLTRVEYHIDWINGV